MFEAFVLVPADRQPYKNRLGTFVKRTTALFQLDKWFSGFGKIVGMLNPDVLAKKHDASHCIPIVIPDEWQIGEPPDFNGSSWFKHIKSCAVENPTVDTSSSVREPSPERVSLSDFGTPRKRKNPLPLADASRPLQLCTYRRFLLAACPDMKQLQPRRPHPKKSPLRRPILLQAPTR